MIPRSESDGVIPLSASISEIVLPLRGSRKVFSQACVELPLLYELVVDRVHFSSSCCFVFSIARNAFCPLVN